MGPFLAMGNNTNGPIPGNGHYFSNGPTWAFAVYKAIPCIGYREQVGSSLHYGLSEGGGSMLAVAAVAEGAGAASEELMSHDAQHFGVTLPMQFPSRSSSSSSIWSGKK
jgi:hypothetical protein